jgi:hypothetical protein
MNCEPKLRYNVSGEMRDNPLAGWRFFPRGILGFNHKYVDPNRPYPFYYKGGTFLEFLIHNEIAKPVVDWSKPNKFNNWTINGVWYKDVPQGTVMSPDADLHSNLPEPTVTRIILINKEYQILGDVSTINPLLPKGLILIDSLGNTLTRPDATYVTTQGRAKWNIGRNSIMVKDQEGTIICDLNYSNTPKNIINLRYNPLYPYYKELESVSAGSTFVDTSNSEPKGFVGSNRVEYFSSLAKPGSGILEQTRGAFTNSSGESSTSTNKRKGVNFQEGSNKKRRGGSNPSKIMYVNGFYTMIANH